MRPRARRKIQRGSRRPEAPCSESNSHRNTDAGDERLINGHYSDLILTVSQFPIIRHLQQLEDKAVVKNSLLGLCDAGRRCSGTLVPRRTKSGVQYILSNNHVLGGADAATVGDAISQPGLGDVGCNASATQTVAKFSQAIPLNTANVDAALAQIVAREVDTSG